MDELVRFIAAVAAFSVVGIGIGMLVARRFDRWAAAAAADEPDSNEDTGDDDRSDA